MRVAPEVDSCGLRISRLPPPHPPTSKTPPKWGQAGQKQGGAIAKTYAGGRRVCEKSVDLTFNRAAGHVTLRKSAPRIFLEIHENTVFIHENTLFIHGLLFAFSAPIPSLTLSFVNEIERERGAKQAKNTIHGFLNCNKVCPRKFLQSTDFSWLKFCANVNAGAGLGGFLTPIPDPRRKMPIPSLKVVRNER